MSEQPPARTGRFGAIFVIVVVAGSAFGVLGWHLLSNRDAGRMDNAGFDLNETPAAERPAAVAAPASRRPEAPPPSSLGSITVDEDMKAANRIAVAPKSGPATPQKKEQIRESFAQAARKYESSARSLAERMAAQEPMLRRYGKDWMRSPDLKKLGDGYRKDKDLVKFLLGAAKSENLGKLTKKYAGSPELRRYVLQAVKESPPELRSAAEELLDNDRAIKALFTDVTKGLGLPPTIAGIIERGAPPKMHLRKDEPSKEEAPKADQNKVMTDIMNNPELQKVMQQGQQAPAVNLGR